MLDAFDELWFRHSMGRAIGVVLLLSLTYATYRSWPRPVEAHYSQPKVSIRLVEGNLLGETCHLAVGFTDTFDTLPPEIIDAVSLQGQLLANLFSGDVARLDAELDTALAGAVSTGSVTKPGKQARYPIGTVAKLAHGQRWIYCVAITKMSEQNRAEGSVDRLWQGMQALWAEVLSSANGHPIAMPVWGGGLSRLSAVLPPQDAIRLIALSFMFASRDTPVSGELRIVIRQDDMGGLDMLELQSFLRSLRSS